MHARRIFSNRFGVIVFLWMELNVDDGVERVRRHLEHCRDTEALSTSRHRALGLNLGREEAKGHSRRIG